jgi:trans-AT polyketide synthase/acyltransferase/oxidoreductase domain-containing protein
VLDRFPDRCASADRVLGYSVRELCLEDPGGRLRLTQHAQPALFVVDALECLARRADGCPEPAFVAGHSLGELAALFAAGCLDFETGVRLVKRRGELMAAANGGAMLAVLGLEADRVVELVARSRLDDLDVANYNASTQVVLSGSREAIAAAGELLGREESCRCVPLNVSAPFHSRFMAGAAEEFAGVLAGVRFGPPRIPVIANVTGRPYPPEAVGDLLSRQIRSPVRWRESMRYLRDQGVAAIEEVGPGRVLRGLWAAALQEAPRSPPGTPQPGGTGGRPGVAERLGNAEFRADYGVRYAYAAGSMFRGVASADLAVRMAGAGLMGFFGTGGLPLPAIEEAVLAIRRAAGPHGWGMNLLHEVDDPALERATVELFLRHDVQFVEAAAFLGVTPALVRFRFSGAHRDGAGRPVATRHVVAKVSRPEVAAAFMQPAPDAIVAQLVAEGALTEEEAGVARRLPVSGDICVEADSAGHTDARVALTVVPAMARLRDELMASHGYPKRIRVGASGGLGAPEAVAAAFVLGADFVVTGSVNQCSPEAGTSAVVKHLLAGLDVQDTAYAPAGDMFELGARVQVVRKGTLFPARGNKLYQLYRQHPSLEDIDAQTRRTIEETYFRRSFEEVWRETRAHYLNSGRPEVVEAAERDGRRRMALVFRWYFAHSIQVALAGDVDEQVNFQVHCGPAMGAFNRFVKGTDLEDWRHRHVDVIAERLMEGAAETLRRQCSALSR